jgi:carbon monoxide dehydrogenase subunit G
MEVKVDRKVPLDASIAQSWALLSDIRAVAGCMPGAEITEQIDERRYKGAVTSRVGPATLRFSGEIEVLAVDAAHHQIRLLGKAADQAGSSASMSLEARLAPGDAPGRATLIGAATMTVSGKLAQFSGRLIGPASDVILTQFSENFRAAASHAASGGVHEAAPAANELSLLSLLRSMLARWLTRLFRGGKT